MASFEAGEIGVRVVAYWRPKALTGAGAAIVLLVAGVASAHTWESSAPSGTPPSPRYGQTSTAYDAVNDRLILFSGEDGGPLPRPNDTWVLNNATQTGASSWTELAPTGGPPAGRVSHSVVYAPTSNRLIVHGGCLGNCSPAASDTWVLTNANGTGGTPQWTQLGTTGADGREGHAAVYDDANNRMIVFGGQNAFNTYTGNPQVRVLSNADGTGVDTPAWTTLTPSGTPPSNRESAGVGYDDANNRMIVFGGATLQCCAFVAATYNDVWVLTNANGLGGTPEWEQLAPVGTPPPARYWHSATYDPGANRLIVFGGVDEQGGATDPHYNDVWVLTNANGLGGTPEWIQLAPVQGPPDARFGHVAAYNSGLDALVVAMGRSSVLGTFLNDVWVLEDVNNCHLNGSTLSINVDPNGVVNIARSGAQFNVTGSGITDPSCGGTTLDQVDQVEVLGNTGDESVIVDLSGGHFEPGASVEGSGLSEIEFSVELLEGSDGLAVEGTSEADTILLGSGGVNLNNDDDSDVVALGVETYLVNGADGSDVVSGGGGGGTGSSLSSSLQAVGGDGDDALTGGLGGDELSGGDNNDTTKGQAGGDILSGDGGNDTLSYQDSAGGVNVDLGTDTTSGADAQGDGISGFENVVGSTSADVLVGNGVANTLQGGAGGDRLRGQAAGDFLLGESGSSDTLDYRDSTTGVSVDLGANTASGGHAQGDVISGFERAAGSSFGDALVGDGGSNNLDGRGGGDSLRGKANGDILAGGLGSDTLDYSGSPAGVIINLSSNSASGGHAQNDTISGFEKVLGSSLADRLTGNGVGNVLWGTGGNDRLDTRDGTSGNDTADGGAATDTCLVDAGDVTIDCEL